MGKNIFENYAFIISFQHLDGEYLCECVDEWVASVTEQIWHPKIDLFYFSRFFVSICDTRKEPIKYIISILSCSMIICSKIHYSSHFYVIRNKVFYVEVLRKSKYNNM